jgi:hypothetical protein
LSSKLKILNSDDFELVFDSNSNSNSNSDSGSDSGSGDKAKSSDGCWDF